jgi:hypothetical protein
MSWSYGSENPVVFSSVLLRVWENKSVPVNILWSVFCSPTAGAGVQRDVEASQIGISLFRP